MPDDIREPVLARDIAKELEISVKEALRLGGHEKGGWNTKLDSRMVRTNFLAEKSKENPDPAETGLVEYDSAYQMSERKKREPRSSDYETMAFLNSAAGRYQELMASPEDRELVASGSSFKIADPFNEGGWIYLDYADAMQRRQQGRRQKVLSDAFLRDLTDKLGSMYCVQDKCTACGKKLYLGLRDKVFKILNREFYPPLTRGVSSQQWLKFPEMHNVCRLLLKPLVELEVKLQHMPTDAAIEEQMQAAGAIIRDVMPIVKRREPKISAGAVREKMLDIRHFATKGAPR